MSTGWHLWNRVAVVRLLWQRMPATNKDKPGHDEEGRAVNIYDDLNYFVP
jgi:hypothetical protein